MTTIRRAHVSFPRVRPILGASLKVLISGVMSSGTGTQSAGCSLEPERGRRLSRVRCLGRPGYPQVPARVTRLDSGPGMKQPVETLFRVDAAERQNETV